MDCGLRTVSSGSCRRADEADGDRRQGSTALSLQLVPRATAALRAGQHRFLQTGYRRSRPIERRNQGKTAPQKNPHARHSLEWASWIIAHMGGWNGYPLAAARPDHHAQRLGKCMRHQLAIAPSPGAEHSQTPDNYSGNRANESHRSDPKRIGRDVSILQRSCGRRCRRGRRMRVFSQHIPCGGPLPALSRKCGRGGFHEVPTPT